MKFEEVMVSFEHDRPARLAKLVLVGDVEIIREALDRLEIIPLDSTPSRVLADKRQTQRRVITAPMDLGEHDDHD